MTHVGSTTIGLAGSALMLATPLAAQEPVPATVSAADPAGLHRILLDAGYEATLDLEREPGDLNVVRVNTPDGPTDILATDCDEAVPAFCETLVLSTLWDRTLPMSGDRVAEANRSFRYVSVWIDDDGDPIVQWAILTRADGIPTPIFLDALERYLAIVRDFGDFAFIDDASDESEAGENTATLTPFEDADG
ncbi:MAG: YbjN domain-containing protein [Erythrobacter sp.]|nr:YbjN domain-containing protein [Erythrobacter sp.]